MTLPATVVEMLKKFDDTCPLEKLEDLAARINAALLPALRELVVENSDQLSIEGCVRFEGCDAFITVRMPRALLLERLGAKKGD